MTGHVRAHSPGRVNLIGDHTDYTGGLAMPMAIDLGTTVVGTRGGDVVHLRSAQLAGVADVAIDIAEPAEVEPSWARYVAGVVHEVRPGTGFDGSITSTVPVGSGLSSSAALELAVALAIGFEGTPDELAETCQRAEQAASGVPCGIMDQLACARGVDGHALLIDFTTSEVTPVRIPDGADVVVIHSGDARALADSAYAQRRSACEAAAAHIGPLHDATVAAVATITDATLRARARHVVSENERVRAFAAAFGSGDLASAGELMKASHRSLRDDFAVSTPALDALVDRLCATGGVYGARLTGAGFGGCVVALCEPGTLSQGWRVRAAAGASLLTD